MGKRLGWAIVVAVGATLVRVSGLLPPSTDEALRWFGTGAWVVWGLDELRGIEVAELRRHLRREAGHVDVEFLELRLRQARLAQVDVVARRREGSQG